MIQRRLGADTNFGEDEDDIIETMLVYINLKIRTGASLDVAVEDLEYFVDQAKDQWNEEDLPEWLK